MNLWSGVDLIEVGRFEREVARRGDALIDELFSGAERAWCGRRRRPAEGHAMLYAAKEALFKALGTGKVGRMAWHDVDITWPPGAGAPAMTLAGETAAAAAASRVAAVHVTIATNRRYAIGWVVLEGR